MSKQLHNNEFDDFKTQFEEQSHLDQGWNSPPDFVFEDAIATVNKKNKKKKNRTIFFLSFFVLITALSINQYYSYNKVTILEEKVNSLSNNISSSKSETKVVDELTLTEFKESSGIASELSSSEDNNIQNEIRPNLRKSGLNTFVSAAAPSKPAITLVPAQNTKEAISVSLKNEAASQEKTISANESTATKSIHSYVAQASDLTLLLATPLEIKERTIKQANSFSNKLINHNKRNFALGLMMTRNTSTLQMKGGQTSSQSLTKYDDYYGGYGLQATLSKPLSKRISWNSTIAYDKIHNNSLVSTEASYFKSNEKEMSSGMTMYEVSMDLESPVGALQHSMTFEVDPLMTREGDIINERIALDQCLSIISLSSGFDYTLIDRSQFKFSTGLNIGGAYISNLESTLESEVSMHNMTMNKSQSRMEDAKMLNKYFSFAQLNSALDIKLKNNFSLTARFGYYRSLNSLRSAENGGPSTYLVNWSSSIGLTKTF